MCGTFKKHCIYFCVILLLLKEIAAICPEVCSCKRITENIEKIRVKCGGSTEQSLISLHGLDFGNDARNIYHMDVSKNALHNVGEEEFLKFSELKFLDLSSNKLQQIDKDTFGKGLEYLERLKLSNNSISHIYDGAFNHLSNLKFLDISSNPLVCDCDLMWLLGWAKKYSIKLQPSPKCDSPSDFKGTLLKKLKVGVHLHCESPMQPLLELFPSDNQVVFEGDELVLRCEAPRVALGVPRESEDLPMRAHLGFYWGWSDTIRHQNSTEDIIFRDPDKEFNDVFLETQHTTPDSGILYSILRVASVTKNHRGTWDCRLRSQQANLSKSIAVHVISKSTEYCKATYVQTNKGNYYWPQTVRGETVYQNCYEDLTLSAAQKATYNCGKDGIWRNLNTEHCAFVSECTRVLEQFAKLNLTATNPADALQIASRLYNFTETNLAKLRDPIDLEFIARTLLKYHDFEDINSNLPLLQLDLVSKILVLPTHLWYSAQRMYRTGIKLLNAAEYAAEKLQSSAVPLPNVDMNQYLPILTPKNVFIEFFNIQIDSFGGITCILFRTDTTTDSKRMFDCSTANDTFPVFDKFIDAAIQVPLNLLFVENEKVKSMRLMIAVYRNANLLPYLQQHENTTATKAPEYLVTSPVIGCKVTFKNDNIERAESNNVKDKINIILRTHPYHNDHSEPIPAWWDSEESVWDNKACEKMYLHRGLLMFSCNRLGYYGLLQNRQFLNDFATDDSGAKFHFSPLGIYIGCAFLFVCAWINIVTYVAFRKSIHMNSQQRHTLVNTWLALSSLCLTFSIGIHQTERTEICRIFGLLMHYFSLCVLLWLSVNLSTMYKRMSKTHRVLLDTDFPKDGNLKKPIMGIYLVGWGIAMIICGISSAVNINEYASYHFCFLHNSSALNAITVPSVILMVFITILILCTYYQLNKDAVNLLNVNQFSDNTQTTENIDLDLFENATTQNCTRRTNTKSTNLEQYSTLSNPISSIVDDYERSNLAHLRAQLVFLLLFIIAWFSAATYVFESKEGMQQYFAYNIIFATACVMLGLFLLLFYTLSRNDTRNSWGQSACRLKIGRQRSKHLNSYAPSSMIDNTVVAYKAANTYDANNSGSRSNSQCSKQRASSVLSMKSGSHNNERIRNSPTPQTQNIAAGVSGMTTLSTIINNQTVPVAGLNSVLHHDIPSADLFYNPNQINVARKFFKKQKRLAKRNNFEIQRQMDRSQFTADSDASSSAYSRRHNAMTLLAGGTKINNTNIHYKTNGQNYGADKDVHMNNDILAVTNHTTRGYTQSGNNLVANIYTNIPETMTPKHEIYKVRSSSRNSKPLHLDTPLNEHDEADEDEDNMSNDDLAPLYVNTSNTEIMFSKQHDNSTTLPSFHHSTPASQAKGNCEQTALCYDQIDVDAMNSIGLPEHKINELLGVVEEVEHGPPELERNTIYVSNSLQITDCVAVDENFSPVFICYSQKQSKSLNNINDIFAANRPKEGIKHSISNNILLTSSTSCVTLNEHPSTTLPNKHSHELLQHNSDHVSNSESGVYKLQHLDTCHSASPTNESDLNYQNSEISIRSHGLYAPQADNDLNLTITDDFPYQSSNTSDIDDANNDFDDEFASFNADDIGMTDVTEVTINLLNGDLNETASSNADSVHASLDELYEAIKRHSPKANANSSNRKNACATETPTILTIFKADNIKTDEPNKYLSSHSPSQKSSPLNFATNSARENLNDTFEEDSSQSSVISYIDPKTNNTFNNKAHHS